MSNYKGNKTPIEEKGAKKTSTKKVRGQNYDEFFQNRFIVPQAIKDELEAKGLDCRFISYVKWKENGNMHRSHWVPYRCTAETAADQFGKDSEGYIRRGDTVLAVRSKERSEQHREFLKQRNERYRNFNRLAASELRERMREEGMSGKVHEGYEENE